MAHLFPTLPLLPGNKVGERTELALLQTLQASLSDAYTLFHSVDWSRGSGLQEQHGEIDIVVLNQAGDVLLIEVKSGEVTFAPNGIYKAYDHQVKDVAAQVKRQYGAMRSRLEAAGLAVRVFTLLVLPDMQVQAETALWPRSRIVDSKEVADVGARIAEMLGPGIPNDIVGRVHAFFENRFQVAPDVSALAGRLQQTATRLSAGLAIWVPRIDVPSGIIRVVGTAGSGKTQLALHLLREADAQGKRAAYLCFNRALADHMARVAPVRTPVETFHAYAARIARRFDKAIDFKSPSVYLELEAHCLERLASSAPDLDFIVLDEVQDLKPEWVQALLSRLEPSGRAILLEDPEQQLYPDREPFDIAGAVTITSHENFRSPRELVKLINLLQLTATEVEAGSNFVGEAPNPIVYETPERVLPQTIAAVDRCLARGFGLEDIAVVSMRGRASSALQQLERLGAWSTRHFTGAFDEGGEPLWTRGDLLVESVRRFKGQAAAAVVLTECDLADLGDLNRRLLFVGLTRARMHLEWVISETTEAVLRRALEG